MSKFIVHTSGDQFDVEEFETKEEARAYADKELQHYYDEAGEGWPDSFNIQIAEVTDELEMYNHRPSEDSILDYFCDYKFVSLTPTQDAEI